ncbi:hypothetical protein PG994_009621 [Apiospora phragmitis]|uniref:Uncharacterized protein n=1 Tax=Apiospora phragmitis TaxID=2905665 RepID=A0ABR1U6P4_9PEZI
MVSFKKILFLGATLMASVHALPTSDAALAHPQPESSSEEAFASGDLDIAKRASGRQMLQWSPSGTLVYLIGGPMQAITQLPAELQNLIAEHSEGTPAQMLLYNWVEWVKGHLPQYRGAYNLYLDHLFGVGAQIGAVYGQGQAANLWGFGFHFPQQPSAADLQNLRDAITAWGRQDGGVVGVLQRANGFFNPADIGAGVPGKRSRDDTCPKPVNVRKYASRDVPEDLDFKRVTRWAGMCDGMPA